MKCLYSVLLIILLFGCQTRQGENVNFDTVSNTPVFDQVTLSKLEVINYSLEKQLNDIAKRLKTAEEPSKEKLLLVEYIDSLSLQLDTMRNDFIHHSGGYKPNTGGVMFPLSKVGARNYFYGENEMKGYAYKDFDKLVESVRTKFDRYLNCEDQSLFYFQNINFYKRQEPNISKPNEFLIKDKSTVEILQVIQTIKTQLAILRLKVLLNYNC